MGQPHVWQGTNTSTVAVQSLVVVPRVERGSTGRKLRVEPGGQVASAAGQETATGLHMLGGRQMSGHIPPCTHVVVETCGHDDGGGGGGEAAVVVMVTVLKESAGLAETPLMLWGKKRGEVRQVLLPLGAYPGDVTMPTEPLRPRDQRQRK